MINLHFFSSDEYVTEPEDSNDLRNRLLQRVPVRQERRSYVQPFYRHTTHDKIRSNKRLSCDEMANILGKYLLNAE